MIDYIGVCLPIPSCGTEWASFLLTQANFHGHKLSPLGKQIYFGLDLHPLAEPVLLRNGREEGSYSNEIRVIWRQKVLIIYLIATIRAYVSWKSIPHLPFWNLLLLLLLGVEMLEFFCSGRFSPLECSFSPLPYHGSPESCPIFRASSNKSFPTILLFRLTVKLELIMQISHLVNWFSVTWSVGPMTWQ